MCAHLMGVVSYLLYGRLLSAHYGQRGPWDYDLCGKRENGTKVRTLTLSTSTLYGIRERRTKMGKWCNGICHTSSLRFSKGFAAMARGGWTAI